MLTCSLLVGKNKRMRGIHPAFTSIVTMCILIVKSELPSAKVHKVNRTARISSVEDTRSQKMSFERRTWSIPFFCIVLASTPPAHADHNSMCTHIVPDNEQIVLTNHCYYKISIHYNTTTGECSNNCSSIISARSYIKTNIKVGDGTLNLDECEFKKFILGLCPFSEGL